MPEPVRRRRIKPVPSFVQIPENAPIRAMQRLIASIPRVPQLRSLPLLERKKNTRREKKRITANQKEAISKGIKGIVPRGKMMVSIRANVRLSEDIRLITIPPTEYDGNDVHQFIHDEITRYFNHELWELIPDGTTINITQNRITREFDYVNNRMRDTTPFNLSVNIFRNLIEIEPTDENCVKTYLRKAYPDISKQKKDPIGNLGTADGVSTEELKEFCSKYHIKMLAYDIHKKVIASFIPAKFSKKFKSLIYLYYGNHIYPIENKYLETKTPQELVHQHISDPQTLHEKFCELISQHILPSDIHADNTEISSFIHDNTHYFYNDEYEDCLTILKAFGIEDKIVPYIRLTTVMNYIETIYTQCKISPYLSFFPIEHIKSPFYYNVKPDGRPTTTIDKNKAYSHAYQNLPYLLTVDYRTSPIQDNPSHIDEYSLYVATPKTPNILMPKQDIYSGQHLLFCKQKFSFTIQERINCRKSANIYKDIIQDLSERIPEYLFKKIMNKTIGSYAQSPKKIQNSDVSLVNKDDRNPNRHNIPYGQYYLEISPDHHIRHIYNRRPIAIQIKDRATQTIYNKMVELKLRDEDIIQIKTDSITFYTTSVPLKLGKTIKDWKLETYKPSDVSIYDYDPPTITMKQKLQNENTIITGYAGNGKSHYIQNSLDLTNSIILASKHSALTQHRTKNLNAQVIQAYEYSGTIPTEHHIIVEEVGILSRPQWDILFRCFLLGKKLTVLGDYRQLLPVGESASFSSPAFLSWMFNTQTEMNTNWRNTFSTEYYDSLIKSTDPNYLKQEIMKHSTKNPEDAEVIIAYRNKTVDQYNAYMLNYLNKTLDDDVPMIATTNDLRKYEIYNQYQFTTTEIRTMIDEEDFEITDHFRPAYARTLYNLQGDQVKSYYIAPEDIDYFTKPREAYTIVSRIQNL